MKEMRKFKHLLLMDTPRPGLLAMFREEYNYFRKRVKLLIKQYIINQNLSSSQKIAGLFKAADEFLFLFLPLTPGRIKRRKVLENSRFYIRKLKIYKPLPYSEAVTLIINEEWNKLYPNLMWDNTIFSNLSVHIVPGNHSTRIKTYGEVSGKIISKILN